MEWPESERNGRPLVIVGARGFAKEGLASYGRIALSSDAAPILGLVDDDSALHDSLVVGHRVLGDIAWLTKYGAHRVSCVAAIGDPRVRSGVVSRLDAAGASYANVIHPTAMLTSEILPGSGIIVLAHPWISVDVKVGRHVHVNKRGNESKRFVPQQQQTAKKTQGETLDSYALR